MGNDYGRGYKAMRDEKKVPLLSKEDLKDFAPELMVASDGCARLVGVVEMWSEWDTNPLMEWVDRSRIRYEVRWFINESEKGTVFKSYDIDEAIKFYNSYEHLLS